MDQLFDNKYRYVKDLGSGGFGVVFLAKEEHSGSLVAIKRLHTKEKNRQQNLIHEMQMVSKFNHSNIVNYKHHFIQDGVLFIVMEYCELGSLRRLIHKDKISLTFVWKWMKELTAVLQLIHEKGHVHRDIKPDNILFTEDRVIKLTDFGVANTGGGTFAYMSPEALFSNENTIKDARVDIYALGVTLLEILTKQNPFLGKNVEGIIESHEKRDFGMSGLPNWQQEIVLKAICKIPEQRFQTMNDFHEAIVAQSVPIVFDKEAFKAGEIAEKASDLINKKKWYKALSLLNYAEEKLKTNVGILLQKGRLHLLSGQIADAKVYFEKALRWNPRLDVQKELGWINLELGNYPIAISLLSDYLHRNSADQEAYNLLLQCYYETNRYESAIDLAGLLYNSDKRNKCFANNYYICTCLHNKGEVIRPFELLQQEIVDNSFLNYNFDVLTERQISHSFEKSPTLKSKLLFMDYRFLINKDSTIYISSNCGTILDESAFASRIIKFGREGYETNHFKVPGGLGISRRHCLILNYQNDVWLYDLESTGTYLNGERVVKKGMLQGRSVIRMGGVEYTISLDRSKLL